jgi:hypothetical protein
MLNLPFRRAKLIDGKTRDHSKENLDSVPGDLRASESYSSLERPVSESTENVGSLHDPSNTQELVDFNIDTNRKTNRHTNTLRSMIRRKECKVTRVEAVLYDSPCSLSKAICRIEVNCNGETKIGDLGYQEVQEVEGGQEALKRFRPQWG